MSFNIALSGIAASKKDLDTTANNIANINTIGFKESRAEFADVFASSLFTNSKTKTGDGVATSQVAQQFHQGSLSNTNNALDLAITGTGFFVTSPGLATNELSYTRAGAFKLNDQNFIVDSNGAFLQTYPVNDDGTSSAVNLTTTSAIQIPETAGVPVPSSEVEMTMNLSADEAPLDPANFDINDPLTFNHSTSLTIFDSLGESHVQTTYFVKPPNGAFTNSNQWVVFTAVDGEPVSVADNTDTVVTPSYNTDTDADGVADATANAVNASGHTGAVVDFDSTGTFVNTTPDPIQLQSLGLNGANILDTGADGNQALQLRFNEPTQFSSAFEVTGLSQNGLTVGRLTGVEVGPDGLIKASFSNGSSEPLARVAMARFRNEQGLTQTGSTNWKESQSSGEPLAGEGGGGTFGTINSAALEQANVDLTTELVDLISAQRNFQANSRALEVNQALSQNILQIR